MTRFLTVFAALLPAFCAADEAKSVIRFANNDMLPGSIGALTTDRLVWESPMLAEPASFSLAKLLDLNIPAEQPAIAAKHEASVTLTNGDMLRGQLAGVSADAIHLDTWYAGRLQLNRLMVSKIGIGERQSSTYRGPAGLDGWKQSGEHPMWIFRNGALRSTGGSGSIAREVELPNECNFAFDTEWRGALSLKVVLFSPDITTDHPTGGYQLTFNQRSVQLHNLRAGKFIGSTANAFVLQENEKARIEIHANLSAGKVNVLINGRAVENWTDPDAPAAAPFQHIGILSLEFHVDKLSRPLL